MKYTIQRGVQYAFSERFKGNLQIVIPLLVILAGVTVWALMPHGSHQKPQTLGIYTIKTSGQNSSTTNSDQNKTDNNTTNPSGSISVNGQPATISPIGGRGGSVAGGTSLGSASSPVTSAVAPVTGGQGGGLGGGTGGASGTVSNTISCLDIFTRTTTLCYLPYQHCTPALGGTTGIKAVDGTCITIN